MCKILVVDDNLDIRLSLEESLRRQGHQVILADNAVDAVSKFSSDIELVITDYMMPNEGDGVRLIRSLRDRSANLKVILMSSRDLRALACSWGADAFFRKCDGLETLTMLIRETI